MPKHYQPLSYWRLLLPLLVISIYLGGGCTNLRTGLERWVERTFGSPTARQSYKWSQPFDEATLRRWDAAFDAALRDTLDVGLPHRERFALDTSVALSAQSLHLRLPPGRLLAIEGNLSKGSLLFGELFRAADKKWLASWDSTLSYLTYENGGPQVEELVFVVQTPPRTASAFELRMTTAPAILFPVAGKDERAIQSFWGAQRDGGRRRHEGNDIFAPKNTPLLATVDGRISQVRNGGLGGKTIWLRDRERQISYYYAHLEEQLVSVGQYVKRGDTIGLVGNTGNARTTAPHLHFGIYADGARDPYSYLRGADDMPPPPAQSPGNVTNVPTSGRHYLRSAPERGDNIMRLLDGAEPVVELSTTGRFHRVITGRGELGYVNFD